MKSKDRESLSKVCFRSPVQFAESPRDYLESSRIVRLTLSGEFVHIRAGTESVRVPMANIRSLHYSAESTRDPIALAFDSESRDPLSGIKGKTKGPTYVGRCQKCGWTGDFGWSVYELCCEDCGSVEIEEVRVEHEGVRCECGEWMERGEHEGKTSWNCPKCQNWHCVENELARRGNTLMTPEQLKARQRGLEETRGRGDFSGTVMELAAEGVQELGPKEVPDPTEYVGQEIRTRPLTREDLEDAMNEEQDVVSPTEPPKCPWCEKLLTVATSDILMDKWGNTALEKRCVKACGYWRVEVEGETADEAEPKRPYKRRKKSRHDWRGRK